MPTPQYLRLGVRRFLLVLALSFGFVWLLGEVAHQINRESYDRPPEEISLVIPSGTAARVALGEEVLSLPEEMVFLVGDVLTVQNEDTVSHELGPLFIPAGTSASLLMDDANRLDYSCSFRPSKYLGMNIRQGTTTNIRLIALSYVAPATATILFVYSLVLFPLGGHKNPPSDPDPPLSV